jgi:hypothetical protein
MATMSAASHRCCASSLRALTVLFVLAALVSDVGGRHHHHVCPHYFSCGGLSNISYPFRRQGDPSGCGVQSYELVCTDTDATIRIGSGTYKVLSINSTYSHFWVVDADLDIQSSCPLPRWDYHARWINLNLHRWWIVSSQYYFYSSSFYMDSWRWAIFVNCSQPIENNDTDKYHIYEPVSCLSNSSFIYLVPDYWYVGLVPAGLGT